MRIDYCKECGEKCKVLDNGISHHIDNDHSVDYDADADHCAIPENEEGNESAWFTSSCGKIEIAFRDMEQVYRMYHPGDCEESVKSELPYFQASLNAIPRETIISVLSETGAWDSNELSQLSDSDLYVKLLWIASADVYDEAQMEELCQWQNDFLSERRREESED